MSSLSKADSTSSKCCEASHLPHSSWKRLLLCFLFTALLLLLEFLHFQNKAYLSLLFCLAVWFVVGQYFLRSAYSQLLNKKPGVDLLVSLGALAAFLLSLWQLIFERETTTHFYFLEVGAIFSFVSAGHWMEGRILARADATLTALEQWAPSLLRKLNKEKNVFEEVKIQNLQVGDHIELKPGDVNPVDSEILKGSSFVDESSLTGEALPVKKEVGSTIMSGAQNLDGLLLLKVLKRAEDSALQKMIQFLKSSKASKAHLQRLADRVSAVFIPVVLSVAALFFLLWFFQPEFLTSVQFWLQKHLWAPSLQDPSFSMAVKIAVSILIVSCPCALGIATPAALMAGVNRAAQKGVLLKNAHALEKVNRMDALIFDKTGTLTQKNFEILKSYYSDEKDKKQIFEEASSLALKSNHPLSKALAKQAFKGELLFESVQELAGLGVEARNSKGTCYRLGSLEWMRKLNFSVPDNVLREAEKHKGAELHFYENQEWKASFFLENRMNIQTQALIENLKKIGKKAYLFSGDKESSVREFSEQAGFSADKVFSEMKAEEKMSKIKELQNQGLKVAFVGDGINDALALDQADLGIAVSDASQIAQASADLILLKADIQVLPELIALCQKTLLVIKQNLFWAFAYNIVVIPLAAMGFLNPILCAFSMGFSDIAVVLNSLRLLKK